MVKKAKANTAAKKKAPAKRAKQAPRWRVPADASGWVPGGGRGLVRAEDYKPPKNKPPKK